MGFSGKKIAKQARQIDMAVQLIREHKYQEALGKLGGENVSVYGKYLAGFCLLQLGRYHEAFASWWSLLRSGHLGVENDCRLLARRLFSPEIWNAIHWKNLPSKTLADVLSGALSFSISNSCTRELERFTSEKLWKCGDWALLRGLFNSTCKQISYVRLLFEARLNFALGRKSELKPLHFSALLMSAGASYLGRESVLEAASASHNEQLTALAREVEIICGAPAGSDAQASRDKWEPLHFFLEFEQIVLLRILSLPGVHELPYILSPGHVYFCDTKSSDTEAYQDRLRAAGADPATAELYRREIYSKLLTSIRGNVVPLSPEYAWLELSSSFSRRLRTAHDLIPTESVLGITKQAPPPPPPSPLIVPLVASMYSDAIVRAKTLRPGNASIVTSLIDEVYAVSRVVNDHSFGEIAAYWTLMNAVFQIKSGGLWAEAVSQSEKIWRGTEFAIQIDELLARKNDSELFLKSLAGKKKPLRPDVKSILSSREHFLAHFTVVANARILLSPLIKFGRSKNDPRRRSLKSSFEENAPDKVDHPYLKHIYELIRKSSGLGIDVLDNLRRAANRCKCVDCQRNLYEDVPQIAKRLGCKVVDLESVLDEPKGLRSLRLHMESKTLRSIFTHDNPFAALNLQPNASKAKVLSAVMELMRVRPGSMAKIREAQNEAFKPDVRFLYGFLKSPDLPSLLDFVSGEQNDSTVDASDRDLRPLSGIALLSKEMVL